MVVVRWPGLERLRETTGLRPERLQPRSPRRWSDPANQPKASLNYPTTICTESLG